MAGRRCGVGLTAPAEALPVLGGRQRRGARTTRGAVKTPSNPAQPPAPLAGLCRSTVSASPYCARVTHHVIARRALEAAALEARKAVAEYDHASEWLLRAEAAVSGPLATDAAIVDRATPFTPEPGQPAAWLRLDQEWQGCFPEDRLRMQQHAAWVTRNRTES